MGVSDEKVLNLVDEIVKVYASNATGKERLGAYIDRVGFDNFISNFDLDCYKN
ncbi:nitrite and sulphite reductase 4Fe-4S domain protein [[Clostridium] sordellii ATCC 9714]|nr:nitrite and sulphite reductase 4Fe-4S domain protein [[Clostridium] sordellii ATCC 9714] [Paeniclostridium sordellii ATCC 9714]